MFSSLNWVDYVILAIFLISILAGFSRGLAKELISLITLVVAVVVASMFATTLAASWMSSPSVQNAVGDASNSIAVNSGAVSQTVSYAAVGLSFAVIFAGTILAGAILGFFINLALNSGVLGIGNRLLGAFFGLGRGFLLNLVLIFVLQLTAVGKQPWWLESVCVQQYQPCVAWLGAVVSPHLEMLREKAVETVQNVSGQLQSDTQTQSDQN